MSELPEAVRERLPAKCRKCPVIGRVVFAGQKYEHIAEKYTNDGITLLDSEQNQPSTISKDRQKLASLCGTWALEFTDRSDDYSTRLEQLIRVVAAGSCPGSTRGDQSANSTAIFRVMAYLTGERSCHNPEFQQFIGDDLIRPQLIMGNWVRPEE